MRHVLFGRGRSRQLKYVNKSFLFRNEKELDETTSSLTLSSLELVDKGTFSCMGVNTVGHGMSDSLDIDVTGEKTCPDCVLNIDLCSWSNPVERV